MSDSSERETLPSRRQRTTRQRGSARTVHRLRSITARRGIYMKNVTVKVLNVCPGCRSRGGKKLESESEFESESESDDASLRSREAIETARDDPNDSDDDERQSVQNTRSTSPAYKWSDEDTSEDDGHTDESDAQSDANAQEARPRKIPFWAMTDFCKRAAKALRSDIFTLDVSIQARKTSAFPRDLHHTTRFLHILRVRSNHFVVLEYVPGSPFTLPYLQPTLLLYDPLCDVSNPVNSLEKTKKQINKIMKYRPHNNIFVHVRTDIQLSKNNEPCYKLCVGYVMDVLREADMARSVYDMQQTDELFQIAIFNNPAKLLDREYKVTMPHARPRNPEDLFALDKAGVIYPCTVIRWRAELVKQSERQTQEDEED